MTNGIHHDMPAEQYFAAKRLNNSGIKKLLKSPAHYMASLIEPKSDSKALIIGSAVHCATLESNKFDDRYTVMPEGIDRRTKEGKALATEIESSGKIVLSQADWEVVSHTSKAVQNHETAKKLITKGNAEMTVFAEIDNIPVKCRMDYFIHPGIIVDLKTTDDASPSGFAKSVANYGYDIQAAWYLDCATAAGLEPFTFIFIVVEKDSPNAVAIYELDPASIEIGKSKYKKALEIYKECMANNQWPGYSLNIETISLPAWAMKEAA